MQLAYTLYLLSLLCFYSMADIGNIFVKLFFFQEIQQNKAFDELGKTSNIKCVNFVLPHLYFLECTACTVTSPKGAAHKQCNIYTGIIILNKWPLLPTADEVYALRESKYKPTNSGSITVPNFCLWLVIQFWLVRRKYSYFLQYQSLTQ